MSDHYETLGVPKTATPEEIKKAYRAKAKEFHPDRNPDDPNAESIMQDINAAYDVLKDEAKRAEYDAGGSQNQSSNRYQGYGAYSDPFSDFMRRPRSGGGPQSNVKNNMQTNVGVPIDKLVTGGKMKVPLQVPMVDGQGYINFGRTVVSITIEPNMPVGSRIVLTPAEHQIASVDLLILNIQPLPDPNRNYRVDGIDIYVPVEVDVFDVLFGEEVEIELPTTDKVRVTLPRGADSGKVMRLAGKGLRGPHGIQGDVKIMLTINVPSLDDDTIAKIKAIIDDPTS